MASGNNKALGCPSRASASICAARFTPPGCSIRFRTCANCGGADASLSVGACPGVSTRVFTYQPTIRPRNAAGQFLGLHLGGFRGSHLVEGSAAALAEAPQIQREHVDPRGSQLSGQVVPNLALTVALMQQQNAGSGLGRSEVCRFELCVVWGSQINGAADRQLLGRTAQYHDE